MLFLAFNLSVLLLGYTLSQEVAGEGDPIRSREIIFSTQQ